MVLNPRGLPSSAKVDTLLMENFNTICLQITASPPLKLLGGISKEVAMFMGSRAVAESAAAVVGAENFTMKSKGKKKLKKAKFKSLAEGSLMSDTDDASLGEDYTLEGSNDPTYRDLHSDMLPLPHRSPSQRKRKAPKLLDEEMLVEMHTKKFKKDVSNKIKGFSAEKVVHNFFLGVLCQ